MIKDRLILEFPNAIPPEKVEWLRDCMRSNLHLSCGNSYNREGKTIDISKHVKDSEIFAEVDQYLVGVFCDLAEKINGVYQPPFGSADSGYEYHLYHPGDVCKEHADCEVVLGMSKYYPDEFRNKSLLRYATVVIYLTNNAVGGELVFPEVGVTISPEAGKAVVFPPYGSYKHYSTPSKDEREILMTWFVYTNVNAVIV